MRFHAYSPWKLSISLSLMMSSVFTNANDAIAIDTPVALPDLTIVAPKPALETFLNNTQTLDEKALNVAHEQNVADVLEGTPSLAWVKSGYGQQTALFIRGAGGLGLVTLDDIPIYPSLPGLFFMNTLPLEALQSVQIDRGPGAISRPFQALGGAIRLYSKDLEQSTANFSLEGGSFGILRESLQGALAGDIGRMTVTLNRGDAFDGTHLAVAEMNPERDPFHLAQGMLRFSSDLTRQVNWQGSVLYRNASAGSDTLRLDADKRVAYRDDTVSHGHGETWLAQNSLQLKITPYWSSQLQLGFTQLANDVIATPLQSSLTNRMYLATLRNRHTLVEHNAEKLAWQLIWGGQIRQEQLEALQYASSYTRFTDERTLMAGFLETEFQYRHVSAQLGLRWEHFEQYGHHPLFKSSIAWQLSPKLTIRATGGTGYRIPGYTELYSLFFGNKSLRPERAASGEVSLEWFPKSNAQVSVTGYYFRYDDLILQAYEPRQGPISTNIRDAEVAGLDLEARYALTDTVDTGFSYGFSKSRNLTSNLDLPVRPQHIAKLWGQRQVGKLPIKLWMEAVFRSSTWNDSANTIDIDGSVQINTSARYTLNKHLEIYLRVENLTNNRSSQFYSIDMPGTAVYGGFQIKL